MIVMVQAGNALEVAELDGRCVSALSRVRGANIIYFLSQSPSCAGDVEDTQDLPN